MNTNRIRLDADEWNEDIDRLVSDHYGGHGHDPDLLRAFGKHLIRAANAQDYPDNEGDQLKRVDDADRP